MRSLPAAFSGCGPRFRTALSWVMSPGWSPDLPALGGCGLFATLAGRWPRQGLLPMGRGLEMVRAGHYPSYACSLSFASGSRTYARAGLCSHPAPLVAGSTCASLQHRRTRERLTWPPHRATGECPIQRCQTLAAVAESKRPGGSGGCLPGRERRNREGTRETERVPGGTSARLSRILSIPAPFVNT